MPLIHALIPSLFGALSGAGDIHFDAQTLSPDWPKVRLVDDGWRGNAVSFDDPTARIDLGPCPADSMQPFTLRAAIRTRDPGFSTPIMAREGGEVGLSLIMGREPGKVSFEAWSWQSVRLISQTRIDDGKWHRVEVEYEPQGNAAVLSVDGKMEAWATLGPGRSPDAKLRLGNNIGAHQPFRGDLDEIEIVPTISHPERFAGLTAITSSTDKANELAALRANLLPRKTDLPADAAAWAKRREQVRKNVADALGLSPMPQHRALEPEVHGEKVGQGVRVQRVSWSSWPGYRATGWLWLSEKPIEGRRPAMLMPHGHWANGALEPVVQVRAARFARAGYIVLIPDSVHVEDLASGANSVGAMTWNNIRALDMLLARDDVDPARVGCTGASGGAQQTMYLMALEDRITAAVPVCMICYYAEIMSERSAHCGCNHVPGIGAAADQPEMCMVFAPRPALFISATGDWTHRFPVEGWPEMQRAWTLAGASQAVHQQQFNAGHGYDSAMRQAAYKFFDGVLSPPNPAASEDGFAAFDIGVMSRMMPPARPPERAPIAADYAARRSKFASIREVAPSLNWTITPSKIDDLGPSAAGSSWRRYVVAGPDGVHIPFIARGLTDGQAGEILVVVAGDDRARLLLSPPEWLASANRAVIVEPRFQGEWKEFADAWRRNAILLGRGEGYQGAIDIAQVVQSLPGDAPINLVALGASGVGGVEGLMAVNSAPRVRKLIVQNLGPRYAEDGNRLPQCPNLLRFGDLDKLAQAARANCEISIGAAPAAFAPGRALTASREHPLNDPDINAALHPAQ